MEHLEKVYDEIKANIELARSYESRKRTLKNRFATMFLQRFIDGGVYFYKNYDKCIARLLKDARENEEFVNEKLNTPESKSKLISKIKEFTSSEALIQGKVVNGILIDTKYAITDHLINVLLPLTDESRRIFAKRYARHLDSYLYCVYTDMNELEEKGYITRFIKSDIDEIVDYILDAFDVYGIDLFVYLRENSDYDPKFGSYDRHKEFHLLHKPQVKDEIQQEQFPAQVGYGINNTPQQYRLELTKDLEAKVLKVYQFWCNLDNSKEGYKNIFEGTTQADFLNMVSDANFTTLYNTSRIKQRVGGTVVILADILGNDWGKEVTKKLYTTIRNLQKNTGFAEYEALKKEFLK